MSVAIEYVHAISKNAAGEVLGINVAVDDLIRAWFKYSKNEKFVCRPADITSYQHFQNLAQDIGIDAATRCIGLDPRTPQHNLEDITCLFRPDPALADMAWRRNQLKGHGYAACGLVHSLAGEQVSRAVTDLCIAPTDDTDVLICPSASIRKAVHHLWDGYTDYLNQRFGSSYRCPVQTHIIPLGIDTDKFVSLSTSDKRQSQRRALGISDDEIVILFVGRLSFATKSHPLPLLLAAEQAAKATRKKLRLILYGYFKPQAEMEPRFRNLVKETCQTIHCDFVMNDDPRFPDGLWASADIFTSLIDNIQESFGLTPIEAMASGLPVVVSNWDGYRDAVQHNQNGYLIPTFMPPASAGQDIANFYLNENNYGTYLVASAQSTSLDIRAASQAFVALAENDTQRRAMGQNGKQHTQSTYDWRVIIPAYEALWKELGEQRRRKNLSPTANTLPNKIHPSFPNPWSIFSHFPSSTLGLTDHLKVVMTNSEIVLILKHDMNLFIPELLLPSDALRELIETIRRAGTLRVHDIMSDYSDSDHPRLWRCLGWLLKHGICVREAD